MDCPKCGAPNEAAREECVSCGVIFARWQQRKERTPAVPRPAPAPEPPKTAGLPPWMLVALVIGIALFGALWTARHRAARAQENPDDLINAINVKGIEQQHQLQAQEKRSPRPVYPAPLPPELEGPVRLALERCTWFTGPITFEVPKQFKRVSYEQMVKNDPMIAGVIRLHFIELKPALYDAMPNDTIDARLTFQVRGAMQVSEGAGWYRFEVGRHRLDALRATSAPTESRLRLAFDWSFENAIADELYGFKGRTGSATLDLNGSAWNVVDASIRTSQAPQQICP
jgi:hypothetical protein